MRGDLSKKVKLVEWNTTINYNLPCRSKYNILRQQNYGGILPAVHIGVLVGGLYFEVFSSKQYFSPPIEKVIETFCSNFTFWW